MYKDAFESGTCRAIGVSNFMVKHLEELRRYALVLPSVNQLELTPLAPLKDVEPTPSAGLDDGPGIRYEEIARGFELLRKVEGATVQGKPRIGHAQVRDWTFCPVSGLLTPMPAEECV